MVKLLLGVLEQSLKAWNSHESTKYLDQLIDIKADWYEEYKKLPSARDHNRMVELESELRILSESFISAAQGKNSLDR